MAHSSASIVVSDDLDAVFSVAGDCYTGTRRRRSHRALPPGTGPAPVFYCGTMSDEEPCYFLDSCSLCKKPLSCNRDIYMYRGDTPFCSDECRQEQIDIDEAKQMHKKKLSPSWKKGFSSSTKPLDFCVGAADAVVAR